MMTNGKCTSHIIEQGEDERKLGRWRWIIVRGKEQKKTIIIGAYKTGASWVTTQNQAIALQNKENPEDRIMTDPTILWIEDLRKLISTKQNEGCKVILTGDFNENVENPKSGICKLCNDLGIREVITEKYGAAPNTHERGTDLIEGVFMSEGMNIVKGGYTSFDESPSDHRWLFIDIDESEIVGESMEARARPIERKATAKIPSVKEKFNCELERQVTFHNLLEKVKKIYSECIKNMEREGKITLRQERETDNLNDRLQRAIKAADQK